MAKSLTTQINPDSTWTWTLTSILGDSLKMAEQRFGHRDYEYTILGVEFVDHTNPYIWYFDTGKHIIIRLTLSCINDFDQGVFQLTHEVIHCLSPDRNVKATYLEEGLATLFSTEYSKGHGGLINTTPEYVQAYSLVNQLLKLDNDIIKKLRRSQLKLSLITESDILKINSSIPLSLAHDLTQMFPY